MSDATNLPTSASDTDHLETEDGSELVVGTTRREAAERERKDIVDRFRGQRIAITGLGRHNA